MALWVHRANTCGVSPELGWPLSRLVLAVLELWLGAIDAQARVATEGKHDSLTLQGCTENQWGVQAWKRGWCQDSWHPLHDPVPRGRGVPTCAVMWVCHPLCTHLVLWVLRTSLSLCHFPMGHLQGLG